MSPDVQRLVLASDRGPVTFVNADGSLVPLPRPGSVTAILDSAARALPSRASWFALSTSSADRSALATGEYERLSSQLGYSFEPVFVSEEDYRQYYEEAGARMLWFMHHGLWPEVESFGAGPPDPRAFTGAYRRVNRMLGRRIASHSTPNAWVLVHDYQLAVLPGILRRLRCRQPIALFTHTPFGEPDSVGHLSRKVVAALVEGMVGADLLGFQRRQWATNFMAVCEKVGLDVDRRHGIVSSGARRSWIRCYPVPADPAGLSRASQSASVAAWERELAMNAPGPRIVRIDRLDPSKNVLRGFEAFELLLERASRLHDRPHLLACLIPSRPGVPEYQRYAARVRAVIERVAARFPGSLSVYWGHDLDRALAAMRLYDVLLINPIRDGMNLVAQEGPLVNTRDGVVVLSTATGSGDLLRGGTVALHDPRDVAGTADALRTALEMPLSERRRRAALLRARVAAREPAGWLSEQVEDLTEIVNSGALSPR